MKRFFLASLAVATAGAFPACSKNNNEILGSNSTLSQLMIDDWSFEGDGKPSFYGWYVSDTADVRIVQGAPANGGTYALTIPALWMPPQYVEATYPALAGTHRYGLSFMGRGEGAVYQGTGQIQLRRKDTALYGKIARISDTLWTRYAVADTFTAAVGDTIAVRLSGPPTELMTGTAFFDVIRLDAGE